MQEKPPKNSTLPPEYYDIFDSVEGGSLTVADLARRFPLSTELSFATLQKPVRTLLLGSATPENIDTMFDVLMRAHLDDPENMLIVVDRNEGALNRHVAARNSYKGSVDGSVHLVGSDIRSLALRDESITVIVSDFTFNFIDDIADMQALCREAYRVLKSGGVFVVHCMVEDPSLLARAVKVVAPEVRHGPFMRAYGAAGVSYYVAPESVHIDAARDAGFVPGVVRNTKLADMRMRLAGIKTIGVVLKKKHKK